MSFKTFFAQPIRSRLFSHIGVYKRTFSSGIDIGIFRFSRRSAPFHHFLKKKIYNNSNTTATTSNRFRLTSMMGLVTISDSIKDALYKSEVIPTVIHDEQFTPKGFLMIQYKNSDKEVTMGNTLKVADTQEKPIVHFTLNLSDDHKKSSDKDADTGAKGASAGSGAGSASSNQIRSDDRFTLVLTDPDAPTKGDEKWSEYCHYLVRDIKLNEFTLADTAASASASATKNDIDSFGEKLTTVDLQGEELVPYMGPGPPPKTGLHRYVFLLYRQQRNKKPEPPADRPCWGTGVPGSGAAEYAAKCGLELYAVNFFYAKNDVQ